MRAEFRKLIALPTPRWTAVALAAALLLGVVLVIATGPGAEGAALGLSVGLPTWLASIVLGAWMIGLEYGQKTMRRVLSADPSRPRVILNKLVAALAVSLGLTAVVSLAAAIVFPLITSGEPNAIEAGLAIKMGAGALTQVAIYCCVGFFLALFTRSMAGGMTVALAFGFIIDSALTALPNVGQYALSSGANEIYATIVGTSVADIDADPELVKGLLITAGWLAVFAFLSGLRFLRADVD